MKTFMVALLAVCSLSVALAADVPVSVYVNNKLQSYNPPALLRGGSVYVPLREGAKSLGCEVHWVPEMQAAQVCTDSGCTFIPKKDGIIVNGSLLLPLRKMGEATGAKLRWDGEKKAVFITRQLG